MTYRLFSLYLTKDVETETKAVQALCSLFTGCMPLMLTAQRDHVIGRMLTPRGGAGRAGVRLQSLRSLREGNPPTHPPTHECSHSERRSRTSGRPPPVPQLLA